MSNAAIKWALTQPAAELKPTEKFLLVLVCNYYNEKAHRAWPSVERLAAEGAMHRTTVMRGLKRLDELGLIQIEPWVDATTRRAMTNRYCLPWHDPHSERAEHLPVLANKSFDRDEQTVSFDTFAHEFEHGEKVAGYAA